MRSKIRILLDIFLPYLRLPLGILLLLLLQTQWPQVLTLGGVKPNLLLILLYTVALGNSPLFGAFGGFVMGLTLDLLTGAYGGLFALSYFTAGLLAGALKKRFYLQEFRIHLGTLLLVITGYQAAFFGLYLFLYVPENWYQGLYRVLLPEAIYTFVLGSLVLWLRLRIKPLAISPAITQ